MKICYRTWGFSHNDWACSHHPTADWHIAASEGSFELFKSNAFNIPSVTMIEWHYVHEEKSKFLRKGWVECNEKGEVDG